MSADVRVAKISEGIYSLLTPVGEAVLMEPSATIFSHLVSRSVEDIEESAKTGITT